MKNDEIESALARIVLESPYNGPIVAKAYRELLAGVKLFGVPASSYHRFLSLIEEEAMDSGPKVLARVAELEEMTAAFDPVIKEALLRAIRAGGFPLVHPLEAREHSLSTSCWCGPDVVDNVVKHR